jgi:L-malate glycosyltransferase
VPVAFEKKPGHFPQANIQTLSKPALLLISAASVVGENRKRLDTLARFFELTCVTCRTARSIGFDVTLVQEMQPAGYRLIGLETFGRTESTTRYLLRGMGASLAGSSFDAILVESEPWAWVRWQAWLYKKLRQPRAIFGEFSWENVERTGVKGAILSCFYRLACGTDDFAIAGNRAAGDIFVRHGLPASQVLVAPQIGVDEVQFAPADAKERLAGRARDGLDGDAFVIGFCGRLIEEKGVTDLVQAVQTARAAHPARNLQLALLGSGPLLADLERMAADRPWLRVLALRPHEEVAGFMRLLDLFVLPSKASCDPDKIWQEQFGHVLIEAMSCGVPCIGSDSGAIPEVIGDEAMTFPAGDATPLAALIGRAVQAPPQPEAVRQRVLDRFTNEAVGRTWAEFILGRLRTGGDSRP